MKNILVSLVFLGCFSTFEVIAQSEFNTYYPRNEKGQPLKKYYAHDPADETAMRGMGNLMRMGTIVGVDSRDYKSECKVFVTGRSSKINYRDFIELYARGLFYDRDYHFHAHTYFPYRRQIRAGRAVNDASYGFIETFYGDLKRLFQGYYKSEEYGQKYRFLTFEAEYPEYRTCIFKSGVPELNL